MDWPRRSSLLDYWTTGSSEISSPRRRKRSTPRGWAWRVSLPSVSNLACASVSAGAYQLFLDDRDKPITDPTKYYHRWHNTDDGGVIVFTCLVALLRLLDDDGVKSFEDDTAFKRLVELNE